MQAAATYFLVKIASVWHFHSLYCMPFLILITALFLCNAHIPLWFGILSCWSPKKTQVKIIHVFECHSFIDKTDFFFWPAKVSKYTMRSSYWEGWRSLLSVIKYFLLQLLVVKNAPFSVLQMEEDPHPCSQCRTWKASSLGESLKPEPTSLPKTVGDAVQSNRPWGLETQKGA